MPIMLLHPGMIRENVLVQDAMREAWEDTRAAIDKQIKARNESGAPLSDVDWSAQRDKVEALRLAVEAMDASAYKQAAQSALESAQEALEPLPVYEPDARLNEIRISVEVLREGKRMGLEAAMEAARQRRTGLPGDASAVAVFEADEQLEEERMRYAEACIKRITVGDSEYDYAEAHEPLRRSGLAYAVFVAARHIQGLPAGKDLPSGAPQPSTSPGGSTAHAAPEGAGARTAVTEAPQS